MSERKNANSADNPFGWDARQTRRALSVIAWFNPVVAMSAFWWVFSEFYAGTWHSDVPLSGWSQVLSVAAGVAGALCCRAPLGPIFVVLVAIGLVPVGIHHFGTLPTPDLDLALFGGAFLSACALTLHLIASHRLADALASGAGVSDRAASAEWQPKLDQARAAAGRQEET
ncbi:MAG: hypothetical protein RLZZ450_851 [Pseudomonadota bacterium]|jgi:hypothetical protein